MKVVIIGGGIAGLASAYALLRKSRKAGKSLEITLLEKEDRWGGKIHTLNQEGFVVEGGPDAYLAAKPWMRQLAYELDLADGLQGTNPLFSKTYILHRGRLADIPTGLTMTIPTEFMPLITTRLLSWPQKARMGLDFLLPPRREDGDESLAGFISRRLGRAAYDQLVGPLLSGIYAGDGDRLSILATFPDMRQMELEHGGLIKGALVLKRQRRQRAKQTTAVGKQANGSRSLFETHQRGLQAVVDGLVHHLQQNGADLRLKTGVRLVREQANGFMVVLEDSSSLTADALILASPAYASAHMLAGYQPELAELLAGIEYVTTATVSLAYRVQDLPPLLGYGYIIPQFEENQALACTWTSSKWAGRAPQGYGLLRVFLGRIQDANVLPHDKDTLVHMARHELERTMGVKAEPEHTWVFRWEKAMPQYNLGHPERIDKIEGLLAERPNLALAGNGYYGIGMPDCIRSGYQAADKILDLV